MLEISFFLITEPSGIQMSKNDNCITIWLNKSVWLQNKRSRWVFLTLCFVSLTTNTTHSLHTNSYQLRGSAYLVIAYHLSKIHLQLIGTVTLVVNTYGIFFSVYLLQEVWLSFNYLCYGVKQAKYKNTPW